MSAYCDCCVLFGRGLYEGPISCPEESYRVCVCVCVCVYVCVSLRRNSILYTHNEKVGRTKKARLSRTNK